jgi:hypothetical protein
MNKTAAFAVSATLIYVIAGFNVALAGHTSKFCNILHSYVASFFIAIYLATMMQASNWRELLAIPFIVDALAGVGIYFTSKQMGESL